MDFRHRDGLSKPISGDPQRRGPSCNIFLLVYRRAPPKRNIAATQPPEPNPDPTKPPIFFQSAGVKSIFSKPPSIIPPGEIGRCFDVELDAVP